MAPEAAITRLRAHIEKFIALELTRTVTTALLEAAAERVIWHSHLRHYQRDINRLKQSL
ncbi:hypothetical protein ACTG13_08385 [Aeromonas hydrophila]|jgi:hypothetical protein